MAAAFDAGLDFTIKRGTIDAVQPSADKLPYRVFAEVSFTDGDGFRRVAAEPQLAEFLATDRSGTFYFYNALGLGVLLAADIYGVGLRIADPEIWSRAFKRRTAVMLPFALLALLALTVACITLTWHAWLAFLVTLALAGVHILLVARLGRIAAAARRIRRSLEPVRQPGQDHRTMDTGRFDNSLRLAI